MTLRALALLQINVLTLIAIIKMPPGIGVTIDMIPMTKTTKEINDTSKLSIFVMSLILY